jgi:pimeloyl-ACP methyl ester carboxylesterase
MTRSQRIVLVGHSYKGWLVRLYASEYLSEVTGMVLLKGGFDNPWRMADGKSVRESWQPANQSRP